MNDVRLQAKLGRKNTTGLPVGVVSICIIDNDKVSHIEAIHYGNMEIEYVKDIPSATVTISTYKRKPKYKWIVYDMLTGDVANVTLQLPESAKNQ